MVHTAASHKAHCSPPTMSLTATLRLPAAPSAHREDLHPAGRDEEGVLVLRAEPAINRHCSPLVTPVALLGTACGEGREGGEGGWGGGFADSRRGSSLTLPALHISLLRL
jgi:hypothetical protein